MTRTRTVRLTGVNSLRRVLRRAPEDMKGELVGAVASGESALLADMLASVPRDSGDLASVIKAKRSRDGMSTKVGPGARGKRDQRKAGWRAKFVEFGTVNQAAQPFVFPAARRHRGTIRDAMAAAVSAALLKIGGRG